jgi:hypothetical protein
MVTREQILIEYINKIVGAGEVIKQEKLMTGLNKATQAVSKTYEQANDRQVTTTQVMAKFNAEGGKSIRTVVKTQRAIQRFQMQWLSLMFTGMALDRTFGGIIRSQMEIWGISEGFSSMLMVIMIPVMEMLSEVLWPILDWFMNMPEPVQKVIGLFILFAAITGIVLTVLGMAALALNGLSIMAAQAGVSIGMLVARFFTILLGAIIVFYGITVIIRNWGKNWAKVMQGAGIALIGLAIALLTFSLVFSAVFGGIGVILIGIYMIWTNWGKSISKVLQGVGIAIIGIGIILLIFIGWWALIPIAVGAAVYLIAKYWDKLPGWIQKPLIFIYVLLEAFGKAVYAYTIGPIIALAKIVWYVMQGKFSEAFKVGKEAVLGLVNPFLQIGNRYNELAAKSDAYTQAQKSGMNKTEEATSDAATGMETGMGGAMNTINGYFDKTESEGVNTAKMLDTSWATSSQNMVDSVSTATNTINNKLTSIPTKVTTVHETIEITSRGTSSGQTGGVTYGNKPAPIISTPNAQSVQTPFGGYVKYFQGGGWVSQTGPAFLHKGEYVNPVGQGPKGVGGEMIINLSPVYNISVLDKRELEAMFRANNTKIVNDLRRLTET